MRNSTKTKIVICKRQLATAVVLRGVVEDENGITQIVRVSDHSQQAGGEKLGVIVITEIVMFGNVLSMELKETIDHVRLDR